MLFIIENLHSNHRMDQEEMQNLKFTLTIFRKEFMESGQKKASHGKVSSNHFLTDRPNANLNYPFGYTSSGKSTHFQDPSPRPRFKHRWCPLIHVAKTKFLSKGPLIIEF